MNIEEDKDERRMRRLAYAVAIVAVPIAFAMALLVELLARGWKVLGLFALIMAMLACAGCAHCELPTREEIRAEVLSEEEAGRVLQKRFNGW